MAEFCVRNFACLLNCQVFIEWLFAQRFSRRATNRKGHGRENQEDLFYAPFYFILCTIEKKKQQEELKKPRYLKAVTVFLQIDKASKLLR